MLKTLSKLVLWGLSGFLLYLSFPPNSLNYLAFFALVGPVVVCYYENFRSVTLGTLIFSLAFWIPLVNWFYSFNPLAPIGIFIPLFLYTLLPFVALAWGSKLNKDISMLLFPFIWTGFEFLRNVGFWSLPLFFLGHTQYKFLSFIQIADIFGVWGVSFTIVLINSLISISVINLIQNRNDFLDQPQSILKTSYPLLVMLILVVSVNLYGINRIQYFSEKENKNFKFSVGLIQPNFSPWDKLFEGDQRNIETIKKLYMDASEQTDIVIPCESIFREPINYYYQLRLNLGVKAMRIAVEIKKPIIITFPYRQETILKNQTYINGKPIERYQRDVRYYNSALLIDSSGKILDKYFKVHTVPFGEWTPYVELIPFVAQAIYSVVGGQLTPGPEFKIFEIKIRNRTVKLGPIICFEDLYPYITRKLAIMGADILINMTNDGWANSIASQIQHHAGALFRAIETRRYLIRATNTGHSSIINFYGKSVAQLKDFTRDVLKGEAVISGEKTIYMKIGDLGIFTILSTGMLAFLISGVSTWRRKKNYTR